MWISLFLVFIYIDVFLQFFSLVILRSVAELQCRILLAFIRLCWQWVCLVFLFILYFCATCWTVRVL